MMASAPCLTASCASSGNIMPFKIILPPQRFLISSMSLHCKLGSNCSLVHELSELRSLTFFAWPAIFLNVQRLFFRYLSPHGILVLRFMRFGIVNLGGVDRPFLISRWRFPSTCRSTVTTRAEQFAAFALRIRSFINSLSRIT